MRRTGAVLLILYGILALLDSIIDLATRQEVAYHIALLPLAFGCCVGGWLLWHQKAARHVGAALLLSIGVFALLMGLGEVASGKTAAVAMLIGELRTGVPASFCGGLLSWGRPARQVWAAVVLSWAVSFVVQAVAYSPDASTMIVIVIRAGVPGVICAWLLWSGAGLHRIGSVLLITWPLSYLIYALRGEDASSALAELAVGVPTIVAGCLLWADSPPRADAQPPDRGRVTAARELDR